MTLTSTAFQNDTFIPIKYTCDDVGHNPPLTISQIPKNAKSLVLMVKDPDAPHQTFTHWVVYNIPPSTMQILEDQVPSDGIEGLNSVGQKGYVAPCPPSGTHRYVFSVYALDTVLDVVPDPEQQEIQQAMQNHVLDSAKITGLYKKITQ
ncbi:MAG TPA: YbhB/YbcL family Raf kinase inhibitor-like protein [Patescibacteria group bacterium]|nr:YbhB/YbcL family Raf kinase inhibitor-like protein [Patescibacteria group bacterium]